MRKNARKLILMASLVGLLSGAGTALGDDFPFYSDPSPGGGTVCANPACTDCGVQCWGSDCWWVCDDVYYNKGCFCSITGSGCDPYGSCTYTG